MRVLTLQLRWAMLLALIAFVTIQQAHATEPVSSQCLLDGDDGTNDELAKCLKKGDRFVHKYITGLRKNKRNRKRNGGNMCSAFEEFGSCLNTLMAVCPDVHQRLPGQLRNVYDVISCACSHSESEDTQACRQSVQCFEDEYKGILSRRCDAFYKFNRRQNTRHRCHFLKENFACQDGLITSACGEEAGQFAFNLAKLVEKNIIDKKNCTVTRDTHNKGFQYTDQCPANYTAELETCEKEHLKNTKLHYYAENDLIVDGKKRNIKQACRHFKNYRRCVNPIKTQCPEGAKIIYEYDGRLRTYLLKLDYICNEVKEVYIKHLPCYKEVLANRTLQQCSSQWEQLRPLLNGVSAHEFYCQQQALTTVQLHDTLSQLVTCYEGVFTNSCEAEGGAVIGNLMTSVFKDPLYLRYKYRPDCKLHKAPPGEVYTAGSRHNDDDVTTSKRAPSEHRPPKTTARKQKTSEIKSGVATISWTLWSVFLPCSLLYTMVYIVGR